MLQSQKTRPQLIDQSRATYRKLVMVLSLCAGSVLLLMLVTVASYLF